VGAAAGLLRRSGVVDTALTRDKARELVARHWTLRTADSLRSLGVDEPIALPGRRALDLGLYAARAWLR